MPPLRRFGSLLAMPCRDPDHLLITDDPLCCCVEHASSSPSPSCSPSPSGSTSPSPSPSGSEGGESPSPSGSAGGASPSDNSGMWYCCRMLIYWNQSNCIYATGSGGDGCVEDPDTTCQHESYYCWRWLILSGPYSSEEECIELSNTCT